MISITTQRLLIVYSDLILQKKCIFSHVNFFALVVVPSFYYIYIFLYSLNLQGHAQKFKLNKVWHDNFIEFKYDRPKPQNEWAFEKTNKPCFCFHFANSNLQEIFSHFILNIKKKKFHIWNLHKIYVFNNIFIQSLLSIKWQKIWFFLKFELSMNPTWR